MVTIHCHNCGRSFQFSKIGNEIKPCACGAGSTLRELAPDVWQQIQKEQKALQEQYNDAVNAYIEKRNPRPVIDLVRDMVVSSIVPEDFDFDMWFDHFIKVVVQAAIKHDDQETTNLIVDRVRKIDERFPREGRSFTHQLIIEYPAAFSDMDWKTVLRDAQDNGDDMGIFFNHILSSVHDKKDPVLIERTVSVLAALRRKGKKKVIKGETDFLEMALRDKVSAEILSIDYFKKRSGRRFAKKLKTFVMHTLKNAKQTLEDSAIWDNAEIARKRRQRLNLICAAGVLVLIAAGVGCGFLYMNSTDPSTIKLEGKGLINIIYSEEPNLSGYSIVYERRNGKKETISVTPDMLSGYDATKLGTQTAQVTYNGQTFDVTIHISAYKLQTTTAEVSGNTLIWDRIEYADEYHIYVSANASSAGDAKYATVTDCFFDLSTVDIGTTFYVNVVAASSSEKYENSDRSENVTVRKLATPSDIVYDSEGGKLKWSAVEGADHYMVTVNGEDIQNIKTNEYELALRLGDNEISITAYPIDPNVIKGVSNIRNIYKLSPVENVAYADGKLTWDAESEASRYNIYCDGEPFKMGQNGKVVDVSAWTTGLHTVKIEAAADSLAKADSDPFECKIHIGIPIKIEAGMLDWSGLNGTSYDVYVDRVKVASELTAPSKEIASFGLSAGEHKIYVVVKDDNSISATVTIKKLAQPTLTLQDQILNVADKTTNCDIWVDGTLYEGDLKEMMNGLVEARSYTVTAVNRAGNELEMDSDTASLTVTRLSPPTISVFNGELQTGNTTSLLWYIDSVLSESPSVMTPGDHTIYAVAKANGVNELNSAPSDSLTVTKLPTPILTYVKAPDRELTCSFNSTEDFEGELIYYRNGEKWIMDLSNLTGINEITAIYTSKGGNVLNSEVSNLISIVTTNVKMNIMTSGANQITVNLTGGEAGLTYQVDVTWYDGDNVIASNPVVKKQFESDTSRQAVSTIKNQQTATRLEIVVTLYASDGSEIDVIKSEWSR